MTKAQFTEWLQDLVNEMNEAGEIGFDEGDGDCGDVWRRIDSQGLLKDSGVPYALDYVERDLVFRLADGLLASAFSYGTEGQTEWWFGELEVNLRDYTEQQLDAALERARVAVVDLEKLTVEG